MALTAFFAFRNITLPKPPPFNRAAVIANFRDILADPRAKVCFGAVFLEAIFIHGLFPYIGLLLQSIGEFRASIAGLLIACFAIGGIGYSLVVPYLAGRVPDRKLMLAGGAVAGSCLALISLHFPWPVQAAVYAAFGCGFYLLHSCIQVHVTDLSQTARGAAASLHSSSFYHGAGAGPRDLRVRLCPWRAEPTIVFGALVVLGVGFMCSRLLRRRA